MRMPRPLLDQSTLDLIISDASEFLDVLNAAGLISASAIMASVVAQLDVDRGNLDQAGAGDAGET